MSNDPKKSQANLDAALLALSLHRQPGISLQAQLTQALRALILSDQARPGARLPPSRALAAELSVSRMTVQIAYDQLLSEGYLTARQGSGTFVARDLPHLAPPPAPQAPAPMPPCPWPPFQIGLPDQSLFTQRLWPRHLERAWARPDPGLLARPDPLGWYPLRQAIADHLSAWRGLQCRAEQVVITSGAREAFETLIRALLPPHARIATEDPGWPALRDVLTSTGSQAAPVRVDAGGFRPDAIPDQTAAVIVTPSRHHPTGAHMPLARRMALLDWARESGGLIVEDDYDSEFRYKGTPLPALSGLDGLQHTVYLGSFSKLLSPALRIGYMVLPEPHLPDIIAQMQRSGPRASLIPQPALAQFMASGEFATHLRRMRRLYVRRQAHLLAALAPVGDLLTLAPDPAGMHLCLPLAGGMDDARIMARARAAGLGLSALSPHAVLPDPPRALLLGYAAHDEDTLTQAAATLTRILRA